MYLPDGVRLSRRRHLDRRHAAVQVVGEEEGGGEAAGGGGDRGGKNESESGGITTCFQTDWDLHIWWIYLTYTEH